MNSTDQNNELDRQKAERTYPQTQKHRIGSRVTDDSGTLFTLVGLSLEGAYDVSPIYVSDDYVTGRDTQFGILERDEVEDVVPAPDDPEKANAARAWAAGDRESLTGYGVSYVLFDNPASVDQLYRFLRFCRADREWRLAELAQRKAAAERAVTIAQIVWADGNQSSTARLLGLNQSRVSRAVAASTSNAP
ncbi:hypothetical protein PV402_39585 [Streptomyces scabiei]|uniref:hypothetical protein n=1 Tax=Streptomyces scabiei TaxID=1930 RepID=UPI0029B70B45|nr:hypothetical protein [Streptomyces scabiei]MDX2658291.1 hypothetical protein [Streptomyces scabiei]MDX2870576.1 hypothetical protein [Streptomyces scabiei]